LRLSAAERAAAEALVASVVPRHGLPAAAIDSRSGAVLDARPLADELGDFAQYAWVLGGLLGDPGLQAQALGWGRTVAAAVDADGLLDARQLRRAGPRFCSSLAACDALWGLVELTRVTGDEVIAAATEAWLDGLWKHAVVDGRPVYGVARLGPARIRVPLTTPMLAGYFAESMVELARRPNAGRFLPRAEQMVHAAVNGGGPPSHLRDPTSAIARALMPLFDLAFTWRGRPASRCSELVKGDVYLLFAVLACWRTTGDVRLRDVASQWTGWIVSTMRADDHRFWNQRNPRSGRRAGRRLQHNHSVIELLLDVAHDFDDGDALESAASAAHAWLNTRGATGLVPDTDGSPDALLDPHVDLAVNLLKLWRLTDDRAWRQRFEELRDAIERCFVQPRGLAWRVNATNGEVLDARIESKFLGLFLKLPILQELVLVQGRHPLADRDVRKLATDR